MTAQIPRRRRSVAGEAKAILADTPSLEMPTVKEWISTGCTLLDLAIANMHPGGIPIGRFVHIFGAESTCKTVLGMTILGYAQRAGAIAFFADVENTFDPVWAQLFGLNCSNKDVWRLDYPRTLEEFWDDYLDKIIALKDKRKKVVVVDSLSAMPSEVEVDETLATATMGTSRAKQMSKGFRKYIRPLCDNNVSVIFIDQTRQKIGVAYGNPETTSGGMALKFYSSVRVHLNSGAKVKNNRDQKVGTWLKFVIDKNKVASPYRSGAFKIIWDYGLDDIASNLEFIKQYGDIGVDEEDGVRKKKSSGRVVFEGKKYWMKDLIKHIEANNLESKIQDWVYTIWQEIHKTDDRKIRVW